MRLAVMFSIMGIVLGLVGPLLLQDRLMGMDITLPTLRGSKPPAPEHHISGDALMRFLRVLGVCFALVAVFCFVSSQSAPRRAPSSPEIKNEH